MIRILTYIMQLTCINELCSTIFGITVMIFDTQHIIYVILTIIHIQNASKFTFTVQVKLQSQMNTM